MYHFSFCWRPCKKIFLFYYHFGLWGYLQCKTFLWVIIRVLFVNINHVFLFNLNIFYPQKKKNLLFNTATKVTTWIPPIALHWFFFFLHFNEKVRKWPTISNIDIDSYLGTACLFKSDTILLQPLFTNKHWFSSMKYCARFLHSTYSGTLNLVVANINIRCHVKDHLRGWLNKLLTKIWHLTISRVFFFNRQKLNILNGTRSTQNQNTPILDNQFQIATPVSL